MTGDRVVSYDPINDQVEVVVGDHLLTFGAERDGWCGTHGGFLCVDALSEDERRRLRDLW